MEPRQQSPLLTMLGKQWQLLGVASLFGAAAMYFAGGLVPDYKIAEQRNLWGPLEPFSFLRENILLLSWVQLAFGLGALICGAGLMRARPWARRGLLVLSSVALTGSVAFGSLCFVAALDYGGIVHRDHAVISAAYTITSVAFYVTCMAMLSSRRVKSSLRKVPSPNKQPNNAVQPSHGAPSGGTGCSARALRAVGG